MKKWYYIIDNIGGEILDLEPGSRIFETHDNIAKHPKGVGEGPYDSIKELKQQSEIFKHLEIQNPTRARKIQEDRFLIKTTRRVYVPLDGSEYLKQIYPLMQHSSNGTVNSKGVLGVHLFNKERVRVIQQTVPTNKYGIWEAFVMVYNPRSKRWMTKSRASTFFPTSWGLQELVDECRTAYENRKIISDRKSVGVTYSGIPVVFIIENGKLKSVYPMYIR
ncbi:MAG: EndoU domain-containing protein [Flavobacteriales bacterium]|nr:EndoU domain-containing protein [Flavobacteriales bacterium]MCW8911943.1 EndoU domain-containing protein [Flavobacteriales bacterium]MCW8937597.1 EndoU domain-containing protein [Flavobacteriales bacterium]MCW8941103.1 EndoU domain-containing protein [Flavobacteriales bacterium]MCW8968063.1 EndoU domain-containing protein [Flavobacteriales bacterium]